MSIADEQQSEMKSALVCVDANVVIWSLVPYPLSDKAQELLREARTKQITLIAPTLLSFEVTSTLRWHVYQRKLTSDEGEKAFANFLRLPIHFSEHNDVIPLA
jgi:predicted nucleic acid-binding protein